MATIPRSPTFFRTWAKRNPQDHSDSFKLPLQQRMPPGKAEFTNPNVRVVQRQDWKDSFKLPLQQRMPPGQQSLVNPGLRTVQRQDWEDSFKLPLQQRMPPGGASIDLPSRGPRRGVHMDWIQSSPVTLTSVVVAASPILPEDFPVPRNQRRNLADWVNYILPWAQAGPTNPGFNEWFNPWGPRPGRQDWTQATPITLTAIVAAPFVQSDWPNPSGPRRNPQDWDDSFKLPLQQVLPPNQTDWPVPRGARRGPQDWSDSFKLPLQQVLPPSLLDWPNPRGPRPLVRDWTDSFKLPLQQVLPPNQTDWPVPKGPRRGVQDWIAPTNIALFGAVVGTPFAQADWPVPLGPVSNQLRGWRDALITDILPPPANYDWPVPRAARRNPPDWILPTPYALTAAPVVKPPIAQFDWPVPGAARRNPQDWIVGSNPPAAPTDDRVLRGVNRYQRPNPSYAAALKWSDNTNIALLTGPQLQTNPGFNEWFNPWGPRRGPQDWIQSTPNTLTVAPQIPLIAQYDWPNPRGAKRNPQDWSDSFKLPLQQVLPPRQTDWPVPKTARRNPQDWIQVAGTFTQPPPVQPQNAQYDWPVPRAARRNPQDWSDRFKLPLQQVLPPTQKVWPLLTPARRRNPQDYILPTGLALYTTVQIMPPIAQHEWPVPKGALQPVITARDFIAGSFNPPVFPVYEPNNTLKNEIRRLRDLTNKSSRVRFLKNEVRS
jgi:hypothetical protein